MQRHVDGESRLVTEYYHRLVVIAVVSTPFPIPLGRRFQQPGEGEGECALVLLRALTARLGRRFVDVLVGDALYCTAPVVQAVEALGLDRWNTSANRRLEGQGYDFGTTGRLYKSALVIYDRQTESWWWQVSGKAIVGDLTGKRLTVLPSQIVSWAAFRGARPGGKVLSRETGHHRPYGRNPYVGYDHINASPFLYTGERDPRLRPMERVVTVSIRGEDVAYPFSRLERVGIVHDTVGGVPIVVFFQKGTASALDTSDLASGQDVGAAGVFMPVIDGRRLTFTARGMQIADDQTKSTWNILGQATAGRLSGRRLEPVVHGNHFWFSWASYRPGTRIWSP
ncbi:MAG: DUF3179 domain-containing (seleno)protein [Armatimonadota bacterium]|nr:DUF3179 domain-containing (seleno)protein [Armatimonadota bacterium]